MNRNKILLLLLFLCSATPTLLASVGPGESDSQNIDASASSKLAPNQHPEVKDGRRPTTAVIDEFASGSGFSLDDDTNYKDDTTATAAAAGESTKAKTRESDSLQAADSSELALMPMQSTATKKIVKTTEDDITSPSSSSSPTSSILSKIHPLLLIKAIDAIRRDRVESWTRSSNRRLKECWDVFTWTSKSFCRLFFASPLSLFASTPQYNTNRVRTTQSTSTTINKHHIIMKNFSRILIILFGGLGTTFCEANKAGKVKDKKTGPNPGKSKRLKLKRIREHEHECNMAPFLDTFVYQSGCGDDAWEVNIRCETKGRKEERRSGLMCSYSEKDLNEDADYCPYIGYFNSKDALNADDKGNCSLGLITLRPVATGDEDCGLNSPELLVKIMPANKDELKIYFSQDGGESFYHRDAIRIYDVYGADGKSGGSASKGGKVGKNEDRRLIENAKSHLERKLCEEPRCEQAKTGSFDAKSVADVCWQAFTDDTFNTPREPAQYCWSDVQCKPEGNWRALPQGERDECGKSCAKFEFGDVCWQAFTDDTFNTPREPAEYCWGKSYKPMGAWKVVSLGTQRPGECGNPCQTLETHQCFADRAELKAAVDKYVSSGCNEGDPDDNIIAQFEGTAPYDCRVLKCLDITSKYGWPMNSWCVGKVTDMSNLFERKKSFNDDISSWDVSQVRDMSHMFREASLFNGDLSLWDVSQVQDMSWMFDNAHSFNGNVSLWDVSRVQNMNAMFNYASSFNGDLSSWNVGQVQDMSGMFYEASLFNGDLSLWDVSRVQNMVFMFKGASSFNQGISWWDISRVQDMQQMFYNARSFNQNLCSWADKNFPYTKASDIFTNSGCNHQGDPQIDQGGPFCASTCISYGPAVVYNIKFPQDALVRYITSDAHDVSYARCEPHGDTMIIDAPRGMKELAGWMKCKFEVTFSGFSYGSDCSCELTIKRPLYDRYTIGRDGCECMHITDCEGNSCPPPPPPPPSRESSWPCEDEDGCQIAPDMTLTVDFSGCFATRYNLKAAVDKYVSSGCNEGINVCPDITSKYGWPINSWCVDKVTDMSNLFDGMRSFNDDISLWDVSQVRKMTAMFWSASSFNRDLSLWNVSRVQDMTLMFRGARSFNADISSWDVSQVRGMGDMFSFADSFNGNLSLWDVSQVQSMTSMFEDAHSFNGDLSLWDVGQVQSMSSMFEGASSFNGDLSLWDVSQVRDMGYMFKGASSFNGNLSLWNVSQVQSMNQMFSFASSFNGDISLWDVSQVQDMRGMFSFAYSFNGNLSLWDVSQVRGMGAMFHEASSFNGDLSLWDVSQVQDMGFMFNGASSFNGNLSLWDVSQVRDMRYMFGYASSFNVDISLWDVGQVQSMSGMFYDASSFNQNLCAWADKNFPYTKASDIFTNSGCTFQSTPQIDQGGPFCASDCK